MSGRQFKPVSLLLVEDRDCAAAELHAAAVAACAAVVVLRASSVDSAIRLYDEQRPACVLVRLRLGGASTLGGRAGLVAIAAVLATNPGSPAFLYAPDADPVASEIVLQLALRVPILDERAIAAWLSESMPRIARMGRDEKRLLRSCCRHAHVRPAPQDSAPVELPALLDAIREAMIRGVLAREPTIRKAARLLGMPESSLRWRLQKRGLTPPPAAGPRRTGRR